MIFSLFEVFWFGSIFYLLRELCNFINDVLISTIDFLQFLYELNKTHLIYAILIFQIIDDLLLQLPVFQFFSLEHPTNN